VSPLLLDALLLAGVSLLAASAVIWLRRRSH
jgi:LPXTG-motif cell wall-anchored protein